MTARAPRSRAEHLWRRLADAQDAALLTGPQAPSAPRELQARSPFRGGGRHRLFFSAGATLGALGIAVVALLLMPARSLHFHHGRTGERGAPGRALVADARSDLPLEFSDGSTVTFGGGSAGRVERLTDKGADVVLDRGNLEVHVVHADATVWLVHAGPFQVRVTGTRFVVAWSSGKLDLALSEGSVVVDGALLGAGVPLRAGQRLTIEGGVVRIESLAPPAATAGPAASPVGPSFESPSAPPAETYPAPPSAAPAAPGGRLSSLGSATGDRDRDWLAFAAMGAYPEAFSAASRLGWRTLCRRLGAGQLLTLADVARYAGAPVEARRAFKSLVARFPHQRAAADAVFSLGRLAYEAHEPNQAARWFKRYVDRWPRGPLADQAAGRLLECAVRSDRHDEARRAARAYLDRAPGGPHASLAREVLGEPTNDGP